MEIQRRGISRQRYATHWLPQKDPSASASELLPLGLLPLGLPPLGLSASFGSRVFGSWVVGSRVSGSWVFSRRCWGNVCVAALPVLSRNVRGIVHQRYENHCMPDKGRLGIGLLNSCLLDSCLSASCLSDSPPPSGRGSSGRGSLGRGSPGRGSSVVVVGARFALNPPPVLSARARGGERLERLGSTKRKEESFNYIK